MDRRHEQPISTREESAIPRQESIESRAETVELGAAETPLVESLSPENTRADADRIAQLRKEFNEPNDERSGAVSSLDRQQAYVSTHLPDYITPGRSSLAYKTFRLLGRLLIREIEGEENLPTGARIFIANHTGGESPRLAGALDRPVHIAAGEIVNWSRGPFARWIMRNMGMVPLRETLSHLSPEQRQAAIEAAPSKQRLAYNQVVTETNTIQPGNIDNIQAMVALLIAGEDVAIFAEGLFSRLEDDPRIAYAGYALVAREYMRVTGQEIPVIPTGIHGGSVRFGAPFFVDRAGRQDRVELEAIATEAIHKLEKS